MNTEKVNELKELCINGINQLGYKYDRPHSNEFYEKLFEIGQEEHKEVHEYHISRMLKQTLKRRDTPSLVVALRNTIQSKVMVFDSKLMIKLLIESNIKDVESIFDNTCLMLKIDNKKELEILIEEEMYSGVRSHEIASVRSSLSGQLTHNLSMSMHPSSILKVTFRSAIKKESIFIEITEEHKRTNIYKAYLLDHLIRCIEQVELTDYGELNKIVPIQDSDKVMNLKPLFKDPNKVNNSLAEFGYDLSKIPRAEKFSVEEFNKFILSGKSENLPDIFITDTGEVIKGHLLIGKENGVRVTISKDFILDLGNSGMINSYFHYAESMVEKHKSTIGDEVKLIVFKFDKNSEQLRVEPFYDLLDDEKMLRESRKTNIEVFLGYVHDRAYLDYIPSSIREELGVLLHDNLYRGKELYDKVNLYSDIVYINEFPNNQKEVLDTLRSLEPDFKSNNLYAMFKHSLTHYGKSVCTHFDALKAVEEFGDSGMHSAIKLARLQSVTQDLVKSFLSNYSNAESKTGVTQDPLSSLAEVSENFREID